MPDMWIPAGVAALSLGGAYCMWRYRRLPNWLTLGGALLAITLGFAQNGPGGLLSAFIGWGSGVLMLLPLFLAGVAAPGDMKLFGALGALVGWPAIAWVALFSLGVGLAAAVAIALARGTLRRLANWSIVSVTLLQTGGDWKEHVRGEARGRVPIAVMLVSGALIHLLKTMITTG